MRAWLLDTGPLVAYLVASEKEHPKVAARLEAFAGQLVTTNAVITEAMHFVVKARKGPALLAEFVTQSGLQVLDLSQADDLAEAARRMEKYSDLPMDYADATLVLAGERSEDPRDPDARPARLLGLSDLTGEALHALTGSAGNQMSTAWTWIF